MTEFVRVRTENGMEATVSATYAAGLDLQVVKGAALDLQGRPRGATRAGDRPVKPKTTVAKEAAAKKADTPAEDTLPKEN